MQTQIRLLHLIRVCTISYSVVLNKHKRKYGDDWAEIFEHTPCKQIILLHRIRVYAIFYSTFSNNLAILLAISDTTAYQTAPSNQGCTISYSAVTVSNKHEIKYGDDSILNIGQKFRAYTVYPDHTATSNPGLRNFLLYFFN